MIAWQKRDELSTLFRNGPLLSRGRCLSYFAVRFITRTDELRRFCQMTQPPNYRRQLTPGSDLPEYCATGAAPLLRTVRPISSMFTPTESRPLVGKLFGVIALLVGCLTSIRFRGVEADGSGLLSAYCAAKPGVIDFRDFSCF